MFWFHFLAYWLTVALCTWFDQKHMFPKFPWRHATEKAVQGWDIAAVFFNQFCVTWPLSHIVAPLLNSTYTGLSLYSWLCYGVGLLLIEECCFYYSHRLLHHPVLYHHIHWFHHRFREPVAAMAISAHPVEHILSNLLPLTAGIVLLQTPPQVSALWVIIATVNAVLSHSGYMTWSQGKHDLHHKFRNGNYGVLGILDWWHGTQIPIPHE
jgi:fatty acid hydroxylase domain-containing protein 2